MSKSVIHVELWFPSEPDVKSYGRLEFKNGSSGALEEIELLANPLFLGAVSSDLREILKKQDNPIILYGMDLLTEEPITLVNVSADLNRSTVGAYVKNAHVSNLLNFEIKALTATSKHLHNWCYRDSNLLSFNKHEGQGGGAAIVVECDSGMLWESEGVKGLSIKAMPKPHSITNGLGIVFDTQVKLTEKGTLEALYQKLSYFSQAISVCLGSSFSWCDKYLFTTDRDAEGIIHVPSPSKSKEPKYDRVVLSFDDFKRNESSIKNLLELAEKHPNLMTELKDRLSPERVVSEADVLRQVALCEGLSRVYCDSVLDSKSKAWDKENGGINDKVAKGIKKGIDLMPDLLNSAAKDILGASRGNPVEWYESLVDIVRHRHTASHFLHGVRNCRSPEGDDFFDDWHASRQIAYLLCCSIAKFDNKANEHIRGMALRGIPKRLKWPEIPK